jgi:6-phosphogluconolactonase
MKRILLLTSIITIIAMTSFAPSNDTVRLFAGTYTEGTQNGFFIFDINRDAGTYSLVSETDAGPNPSYFCISKSGKYIYAANEVGDFKGVKGGGVTALSYDAKSGKATRIGDLPVPNGGPAFIAISPKDNYLFIANYGGGSLAVVKLNEKGIPVSVTDTIIYKAGAGKVSHAHMVAFDPSGKRVYLTDLGLDRIMIYNFDSATGKLSPIPNGEAKLAKGAGPRHFVFTADGKKLYVINELNSTLTYFSVAPGGELTEIQTLSTLRDDFKGKSYCADIHLGKDEKFLYGSNRGENTIVVFRVGTDGKLTVAGRIACGGDWPRNFVIDPDGKFIYVGNQNSGNISMFRIDENSGLPVGPSKDYKLAAPVCLKFIGGR